MRNGGHVSGANLYAYVGANPVNPSGNAAICVFQESGPAPMPWRNTTVCAAGVITQVYRRGFSVRRSGAHLAGKSASLVAV